MQASSAGRPPSPTNTLPESQIRIFISTGCSYNFYVNRSWGILVSCACLVKGRGNVGACSPLALTCSPWPQSSCLKMVANHLRTKKQSLYEEMFVQKAPSPLRSGVMMADPKRKHWCLISLHPLPITKILFSVYFQIHFGEFTFITHLPKRQLFLPVCYTDLMSPRPSSSVMYSDNSLYVLCVCLTSLGPGRSTFVLEYCSDILFTTMCKGPYNSLSAFLCIWSKWHALSSCRFEASILTLPLPFCFPAGISIFFFLPAGIEN